MLTVYMNIILPDHFYGSINLNIYAIYLKQKLDYSYNLLFILTLSLVVGHQPALILNVDSLWLNFRVPCDLSTKE